MKQNASTQEMTPDEIAYRWVKDISGFVSPPNIYLKVLELVESHDASAHEIGNVISQDPNLTARLLKLVNSPLYNYSAKIDTVSRAITVIGIRELYSLVLAVAAIKSFSRIPGTIVNMDTFWRHSIFCGLIARRLGVHCNALYPERLFIAGLLHDVGSLVMYARAPDTSRSLLLLADGDEAALNRAEHEEFGFSHGDLGGLLMTLWRLPDSLAEAVSLHHTPEVAAQALLDATIVHVADALANRSELGAFFETGKKIEANIGQDAMDVVRLTQSDIDEGKIIGDAGIQFTETVSLLLAKSGR